MSFSIIKKIRHAIDFLKNLPTFAMPPLLFVTSIGGSRETEAHKPGIESRYLRVSFFKKMNYLRPSIATRFKADLTGPEGSFYLNIPAGVALHARQKNLLKPLELMIALKYRGNPNGFILLAAKDVSNIMSCCRQTAAKYLRQLEETGWIERTSRKGEWHLLSWAKIAAMTYRQEPDLMNNAWRKKSSWQKKIKVGSGINLRDAIDTAFLLDSQNAQKRAMKAKADKTGVGNLYDVNYPVMTGKRFSTFLSRSASTGAKRLRALEKKGILQRMTGFKRKSLPVQTALSVSNAFVHKGCFFSSFPACFSVVNSLGLEVVRRLVFSII